MMSVRFPRVMISVRFPYVMILVRFVTSEMFHVELPKLKVVLLTVFSAMF